MSHSRSRAVPERRYGAGPHAPGAAPESPDPDDPAAPGAGTVRATVTRAAELSACCLASFVMTLLALAVILGLSVAAYLLFT